MWEKDWENVAESLAKRKGQHHEGIRFEAVSFADDRFDLGNATDKSVFSCAMAVTGKFQGWEKKTLCVPGSQHACGPPQRL